MTRTAPHVFFHSEPDSADDWREALAPHFETLRFSVDGACADPASVDVALVWKLPPQGLDAFTRLRAVQSLHAGVNHLDMRRIPAELPIARLVDPSLGRYMVEYAKAAVYRYHRRFHEFERLSREGVWRFSQPTLAGTTSIGVLGLGVLGSEIASALHGEGFEVFGWSRAPKAIEGIRTYAGAQGLREMVARSRIVINVLPLTDATRHVLAQDLFDCCQPRTFLINIGRGDHLVEPDLLSALERGQIEAATLDVAAIEPLPPDHAFWNHPAILLTPHVAGSSTPALAAAQVAENIRRALAGKPLLQQIDRTKGY